MKKSKSYYLDEEIHEWISTQGDNENRSGSRQLGKILRDVMKEVKKKHGK